MSDAVAFVLLSLLCTTCLAYYRVDQTSGHFVDSSGTLRRKKGFYFLYRFSHRRPRKTLPRSQRGTQRFPLVIRLHLSRRRCTNFLPTFLPQRLSILNDLSAKRTSIFFFNTVSRPFAYTYRGTAPNPFVANTTPPISMYVSRRRIHTFKWMKRNFVVSSAFNSRFSFLSGVSMGAG